MTDPVSGFESFEGEKSDNRRSGLPHALAEFVDAPGQLGVESDGNLLLGLGADRPGWPWRGRRGLRR